MAYDLDGLRKVAENYYGLAYTYEFADDHGLFFVEPGMDTGFNAALTETMSWILVGRLTTK